MRTIRGTILAAAIAVGGAGSAATFADKDGSCPVSTNVRGHENIEWSKAYAYGLTDETKDLPRVLLVGDSICNGYQEGVRERLKGKVNVSYWVSSYCATSAAYLPLLTIYLDEAKYDVIHFNNGLHSLATPTDAWAKDFKAALELIRRKQPAAKIVWCTSTPLADETKTAKSRELNAAGAKVVAELGGIATNDLFALCDPLDRATNWSDVYHFRTEAKARQADQVATSVIAALSKARLSVNGVVVNGEVACDVECRAFPDGEAVRYRLPDDVATVSCERTEWRLPVDAYIWYQPQNSGYETPFKSCRVGEIPAGERMNLPITAKLADGTYRLLTEANVVDYTDSCVEYCGDGRFAIRYYADEKGFARSGVPHTPWRVTLVAKDLQTLATSDIVRRLCPDPSPEVAAKCAAFVKGGRSVWQWLPAGDPKYGEQKEWYDRTKALGFEYYLIDDGWKVWRDGDMDQWACLKKWIDYGKSIGVESFVWVDSKEMRTTEARRAYLSKVRDCGAVGIKIDFVPEPSCSQMRWYEETLADTLEFSLMTDFHGCVKPSGRERTWPHEVAREAIRGHEWHITRYNRVLPPEHDCILPFNRLVQGHADYTPMVFEKKELQGYSWARELAQGVVFSARFLCFGDYPQNYLDNPAAELIKSIPAEYDETRILPGSEIGKCVAVAKRKGRDWFVAVENGAEELRIAVKLDFLGEDSCELLGFADAEDKPDGYRIDRRAVERDGKIELTLRPCGGYCARIAPATGSTSSE